MSEPILARAIRSTDLRPAPVAEHCALCRSHLADGRGDTCCERGGIPIHFDCSLEHLSSPEEHAAFHRAVETGGDRELEQFVFLCPGCRS